MPIFKNHINVFAIILCYITGACCTTTCKISAMENKFEVQTSINKTTQGELQTIQAKLDSLTENILTEFNTTLIKNNKIDAMGTTLALMMIISYAFVGCVPPHIASSSSVVHAAVSILNQHIKNKGYAECVENLKELNFFTQQILREKTGYLYSEKILNITKIIEKNVLAKITPNKKAYLFRIAVALPFIMGYFFFAELNATSKLFPEISNELKGMIKIQSFNKDAELNEEQMFKVKAMAALSVIVQAFLRMGYGFRRDGNYYMYPWLVGAILEIINLHYIRCSNRDYSEMALDTIKEIKESLKHTGYPAIQ